MAERRGSIPAVPRTLNPHAPPSFDGVHGGWEKPRRGRLLRSPVTPYLGLRARLSQIWFNRWTVLLVLVLVRVLLLCGSLNVSVDGAREKALTACAKVEDVGSAMASMPHYLSAGVNSLAADGVGSAVRGLVTLLDLIMTAVEKMVVFVINLYVGTYSCLIFNLVHVGLDAAVDALEDATRFFNDNIATLTGQMADTVGAFQNTVNAFGTSLETELNKAKDAVDKAGGAIKDGITGLFTRDLDIPTIDITSQLDSLRTLRINTTSAIDGLKLVNETVPEWEEAKKAAEDTISIPFDKLRGLLNQATSTWTFDKDIFPLAEKQTLSFCSDNSALDDFFTSLFALVATAKLGFVVTIIILAILVMFPMGYLEMRRWRKAEQSAKVLMAHGYDPLDVVYIASRPHTAAAAIHISSGFRGERQLLVRWAVAYATTPAALFVLSLAVAGFFSCACQYGLLRAVQKEAPALAAKVGDFAGAVVRTMDEASTGWARDANREMSRLQDGINDDVFGWVQEATTAVNDTLETVDQAINSVIDKAFGSVPLVHDTLRTVVYCVVGAKIDMVEKGLTWVHDHARVSLPMFPNDTFSQGAHASMAGDDGMRSFLASPAAVTTDDITDAVDRVVAALRNSILQEALVSTGILLLYLVVVLLGVVRALAGMAVARSDSDSDTDTDTPKHPHSHPPPPPSPRRSLSVSDIVFCDEKRWDGQPFGTDSDRPRLGRVREVLRKISMRKTRHSSHAQVESVDDFVVLDPGAGWKSGFVKA